MPHTGIVGGPLSHPVPSWHAVRRSVKGMKDRGKRCQKCIQVQDCTRVYKQNNLPHMVQARPNQKHKFSKVQSYTKLFILKDLERLYDLIRSLCCVMLCLGKSSEGFQLHSILHSLPRTPLGYDRHHSIQHLPGRCCDVASG